MRNLRASAFLAVLVGASSLSVCAGDAPAWMHAVANTPLPAHDEKTDAIMLYSEDVTVVQPDGKMKSFTRRAYKILRPAGREHGTVTVEFGANEKITGMKGWCIPTQGKDYEVKDKDAVEGSLFGVEDAELITDLRTKRFQIPASEPGNIVGYEIEADARPYILQDHWVFQHTDPVVEARYTLELPANWEYNATWLNHAEVAPTSAGSNQWQWVLKDIPGIREEPDMPPWRAVTGQLVISLTPPAGFQNGGFKSWSDMGKWQAGLAGDRREASPEIKQKVAGLTASAPTLLAKIQGLAAFVQGDIRYVAIELGIGGWQPHAAPEVFTHRYGDCKDKATLMSTMLQEIGVDSYYIAINTTRGGVTAQTPPMMYLFNHVILAIHLPDSMNDPSLQSVYNDPKLGRLLIFDPTDQYTPFGDLRGELQKNFGLLVTPEGGELVSLPQMPPQSSGVTRVSKMTLDSFGTLQGDVHEIRRGDFGMQERYALKSVSKDADRIKHIETLLAQSLANFQLTKASVTNLQQNSQPFIYDYSLVSQDYAKHAGPLVVVRPHLIGSWSSDLLETKEPREFPVEFDGPQADTEDSQIALPSGYVVDDLPPPVDADYSFASYHSKTEATGNTIHFTRRMEIKELSVPVSKLDELKKFYRIIAGDERNTAVIKPSGQ